MTFTPLSNVHEIDLTRAGIMPIPFNMPALWHMPDGAIVRQPERVHGDHSRRSAAIHNWCRGDALLGFRTGRDRQLLRERLAGSNVCSGRQRPFGRVSRPPELCQGFITVDGIGQTSGKRAGGVFEVLNTAPTSPGLAMAPHALGPNGARTFLPHGHSAPGEHDNQHRCGRRRVRGCPLRC